MTWEDIAAVFHARAALQEGREEVSELTEGAGHDAQMMARVCPTAMVFVPSINGISHNPAERTKPADLQAGADVLLQVIMGLADAIPRERP